MRGTPHGDDFSAGTSFTPIFFKNGSTDSYEPSVRLKPLIGATI